MAKKKSEEHSGADANDSDYNEEPNFEDPPNFVDNISDEGKFFYMYMYVYTWMYI